MTHRFDSAPGVIGPPWPPRFEGSRPAMAAGLDPSNRGGQGGPITPGAESNLCVIDPTATWTVDPMALASRSRNTPYAGRTLTGRVRHTVFRGEPVVIDGEAQ